MKKIINAVIASACMLFATSCSMAIAGNNKADAGDSFKEDLTVNVADGNTAQTPFKVTAIAGAASFDNTTEDTTYITIRFNANVNKTSVEGITINTVKDDLDADTGIYKTGSALTFTSAVNEKEIQLGVKLKDVDAIEVFVDASKVTAKNGQKLDMDGDGTGAEVEDSESKYFYSSAASFANSGERKFRYTLSPTFTFQKSETKGLIDELTVDLDVDEDLSSVLKANLVVQSFDAASKTWSDVAFTDCLYTSATQKHTLKFAAIPEGTFCRLVSNDVSKIKTEKKYLGYERVYTTDCKVKYVRITSSSYSTKDTVDQNFFSAITADASVTSMNGRKVIEINSVTFTVRTTNSSYSNDKLLDSDSYIVTGVQDMEIINHVKFYDTNLNALAITSDNVNGVYTTDFTYGVNTDKTGYKTVTYYLKKPVVLPKYGNFSETFRVYADEDLTIKFYTYSGTTEKGTVGYKMGKSYLADEAFIEATAGCKELRAITIGY